MTQKTQIERIQEAANELEKYFKKSGLTSAYNSPLEIAFKPNEAPRVVFYWYEGNDFKSRGFQSKSGDIFIAIALAKRWLSRIPSPEQMKKNEFIKATANLIELGKSANIDVDFLNPLEAMMKDLSKNAIEFHPFAQVEEE